MRFPRIRLVEQTEQKFRRFESVFKKEKTSDCDSRALLLIKAPTKKKKEENMQLQCINDDVAIDNEENFGATYVTVEATVSSSDLESPC